MKIVRTGTRSIIIATQAFSFFFWSRFYASALSGRDTRDPVSKELMGGERGCHESFRIVARRRCNVFRCIRISSFRIIYINPLVFRCSIIGKVFKKISFSETVTRGFINLRLYNVHSVILYIYFIPKFNIF